MMQNKGGKSMRSEHFQCLLALNEAGSINKASKILETTPQNISKMLRQLEDEMAIVLAERTAQGIRFTDAGQEVFQVAESTLRHLERIKTKYKQRSEFENITGEVTIISERIPNLTFLNQAVLAFKKLCPKVNIMVREEDIVPGFQIVHQNRKYIGIFPGMVNERLSTLPYDWAHDFELIPLNEDRICLMVQKGSDISKQNTISFQEYVQHPWTIIVRKSLEDTFFMQFLQQSTTLNTKPFMTGSMQGYLQAIADGGYLGLSSIKAYRMQNLGYKENLSLVEVDQNTIFYNYLFLRKNPIYNQATTHFIQFLQEYMQTEEIGNGIF